MEPSGTFSMVTPQKLVAVTRAADVDFLFTVPSILEVNNILFFLLVQ
jgi:hypothetical protein